MKLILLASIFFFFPFSLEGMGLIITEDEDEEEGRRLKVFILHQSIAL